MEDERPIAPPAALAAAIALEGLLVLARVLTVRMSALTLLALGCWALALLASIRGHHRP